MAERSEAKRAIRAAFEGAAPSYDEAASVQREICRHLSLMAHSHGLIDQRGLLLDVGCGTGFGLEGPYRHKGGQDVLAGDEHKNDARAA